MRFFLAAAVALFATVVSAVSSSGNRLLVLLDNAEDKAAYTSFLGDLSGGFLLATHLPFEDSV